MIVKFKMKNSSFYGSHGDFFCETDSSLADFLFKMRRLRRPKLEVGSNMNRNAETTSIEVCRAQTR